MGYLHDGHMSLVKKCRGLCDDLVASIFVNPTQFGPGEDLSTYPRNLDRDLALLENAGTDAVFTPNATECYPEGYQTFVSLENLPNHLCGISRPIHFRGVATVVTKLFNMVKPHVAVFGEKDFQQLLVIRQMTHDLNFDIEIVGGPIVRESDGLAMSSRNSYLSADQRNAALSLFKALNAAMEMVESGSTDAGTLKKRASDIILSHPGTAIDYIAICDPGTLAEVRDISGPVLMALAVKIGKTRLIDNMILKPRPG